MIDVNELSYRFSVFINLGLLRNGQIHINCLKMATNSNTSGTIFVKRFTCKKKPLLIKFCKTFIGKQT